MPTTFIQRNKRKSPWALLLLLLRWRKGLAPLLLMVGLTMFVFVAPPNLMGFLARGVLYLPGGAQAAAGAAWLAEKLGVGANAKLSYEQLLSIFRQAREDRSSNIGYYFGESGLPGRSGLDMVRGAALDQNQVVAKIEGGRTISGIARPEDGEDRVGQDGVSLGQGDLGGLREGLAFAGGFSGAYAGKEFFNGSIRPGDPSGGTILDGGGGGLGGGGGVGGGGGTGGGSGGGTGGGGRRGSISSWAIAGGKTARGLGAILARYLASGLAFVQLNEGNAYNQVSVAPACTASNGCPGEFSTTHSGAVYDGNHVGGQGSRIVTTIPQVDGVSTVNVPDGGTLQNILDNGNQIQQQAAQCQAAEQQYLGTASNPGPVTIWEAKLQQDADQMNAQCSGGGCNSNCQTLANQMKSDCRTLNSYLLAEYNACPLNTGGATQANCN